MKLTFCIPFCLLLLCSGCAKQISDEEKAEVLVDHLNEWYNDSTGLWETTSWWNGANVLTALIKYGQLSGKDTLKALVENTFLKTKAFEVPATDHKPAWVCSNYMNEYYDDEGWWALAWLDAWEWTGKTEYLEMARTIFEDMTLGWDENCGGGMFWKKHLDYKGTITNELTMLLAARLQLEDTGEVKGKSCLQWAEDIWDWMLLSKLQNEKGLVQDGIRPTEEGCKIAPNVWTYNQGVVLSGLVYLNRISGEEKYLDYAHEIAGATLNHMVDSTGVLYEVRCEPDDCNADAVQFKGIFMRHLAVLNRYAPKAEYKRFMELNAESIWEKAMLQGTKVPGASWSSTSDKYSAATTSSALDALNAARTSR